MDRRIQLQLYLCQQLQLFYSKQTELYKLDMKYGERLKQARSKLKLTQDALAAASGTSQANISALERGDATGSEFTAQFAIACEVNPLWLAAEKGDFDIGVYIQDKDIASAIKALDKLKPYQREIAKKEMLDVISKIVETSEKFK